MLRVEESRARLRLHSESVMLAFEKQLVGKLQACVNVRKAMREMDVGGGTVSWDEVVRGARELQYRAATQAATAGHAAVGSNVG